MNFLLLYTVSNTKLWGFTCQDVTVHESTSNRPSSFVCKPLALWFCTRPDSGSSDASTTILAGREAPWVSPRAARNAVFRFTRSHCSLSFSLWRSLLLSSPTCAFRDYWPVSFASNGEIVCANRIKDSNILFTHEQWIWLRSEICRYVTLWWICEQWLW